jgi:hypothetical protein
VPPVNYHMHYIPFISEVLIPFHVCFFPQTV